MATYLDWAEWLIHVKEIPVNWWKGITELVIIDTEEKAENALKNKIPEELIAKFNEIYDNFNEKTPLKNSPIKDELKWKNWEIYSNFIKFCDFLIDKINNSTNKKEIKKIPLIISNLSSYKWSREWTNIKEKNIKNKRNEVMNLYNKKVWKPKSGFR